MGKIVFDLNNGKNYYKSMFSFEKKAPKSFSGAF